MEGGGGHSLAPTGCSKQNATNGSRPKQNAPGFTSPSLGGQSLAFCPRGGYHLPHEEDCLHRSGLAARCAHYAEWRAAYIRKMKGIYGIPVSTPLGLMGAVRMCVNCGCGSVNESFVAAQASPGYRCVFVGETIICITVNQLLP